MKKLVYILEIVTILILLTGCSELKSTEYKDIEVTIKRTYYSCGEVNILNICGFHIPLTRTDSFNVVVEYRGRDYRVDDLKAYIKYRKKIGKKVDAKLVIDTYNNKVIQYILLN